MVEGSLRPGPAGPARHKGHVRRPFDSEATQAWQPSSPTAYLLLYGTMYAAFGVASPFWPRLFESKGLTPQQIGLILSAALLVRLAAGPLIGRVADILAALRLVLATCMVMAAVAAASLASANSFRVVLAVAMVQAAALAPVTSLADALAVNAARPVIAGKPFEYGWIRGAASAAFLSGTLFAGQLVNPTDLIPIIWMNVALLAVAAASTALLFRANPRSAHDRTPVMANMRALLRMPSFRSVIVVSALIYGSHALYDAFAVIRWSHAGLDMSTISVLWAEAVAAEVVVFFVLGPWILDRLGAHAAALLAATAGVVRWSVMGFTDSLLLLSFLQPLHGFTFALLHLACMRIMAVAVPPGVAATAQAIYALTPV